MTGPVAPTVAHPSHRSSSSLSTAGPVAPTFAKPSRRPSSSSSTAGPVALSFADPWSGGHRASFSLTLLSPISPALSPLSTPSSRALPPRTKRLVDHRQTSKRQASSHPYGQSLRPTSFTHPTKNSSDRLHRPTGSIVDDKDYQSQDFSTLGLEFPRALPDQHRLSGQESPQLYAHSLSRARPNRSPSSPSFSIMGRGLFLPHPDSFLKTPLPHLELLEDGQSFGQSCLPSTRELLSPPHSLDQSQPAARYRSPIETPRPNRTSSDQLHPYRFITGGQRKEPRLSNTLNSDTGDPVGYNRGIEHTHPSQGDDMLRLRSNSFASTASQPSTQAQQPAIFLGKRMESHNGAGTGQSTVWYESCSPGPIAGPPLDPSTNSGDLAVHFHHGGHQIWLKDHCGSWVSAFEGQQHPLDRRFVLHIRPSAEPQWVTPF